MKVGEGCGKRCPNFSPLPLDDSAIRQHLKGIITLGAYLVKEDSVKTLIFDFDAKRDETLGNLKAEVNKLIDALSFVGISSYVEFSGNKGYHVWVFFSNPVKASISRRLATIAIEKAGLSPSEVEVFPKQDQTDSFGNLVKLPLGIHKKTGKRCEFLDGNFEPVSDQLQFLNDVQTVDAASIETIVKQNHQVCEETRVVPTRQNLSVGLPCVRRLWEGVQDGHRDEAAFFLARQLKRNGIPQEFAEMSLVEWDQLNQPPLGSKTISEKLESAYKNDYAALDCDNPHINRFCVVGECPVKLKRQSTDNLLDSVPVDTPREQLFERLLPALESTAKTLDEATAIDYLRSKIKPRYKLAERDLMPYEKKLRELCRKAEFDKKMSSGEKVEEESKKMSEEDKQEALDFLKRPDIDEIIIKDISEVGYVGENANKLFQYLVATSRKLDSPLSTIIKSPSAWGKSALLNVVKELMPTEDVEYYTRLTKEALAYMKNKTLKNKWLIVMERKGSEEGDYNIRIMQSEKEIVIAVPVKNPVTGQIETEDIKVEGPIAYSESTTQTVLNNENETRVFDIYLDGSEEQTKLIKRRQAEDATLEGILRQYRISPVIRKHQNAQRLLQTHIVEIPYAKLIRFPTADPTSRRHRPKFQELIKVIAFLRQYQKEVREANEKGSTINYIQADLKDYQIAWKYGREILGATLAPLPKLSRDMLRSIRDGVKTNAKDSSKKSSEVEFTRKEVAVWVGRDESYVRTHIAPLEKNEYLQIKEGGQGKAYKYLLAAVDEQIDKEYAKGITTPEELASLLSNNGN